MAQQRFMLDWDCAPMPGALTHVSLFDGGKDPLHVVASGHGTDKAHALDDLLNTLRERSATADAVAFVTREYSALTGTAANARS